MRGSRRQALVVGARASPRDDKESFIAILRDEARARIAVLLVEARTQVGMNPTTWPSSASLAQPSRRANRYQPLPLSLQRDMPPGGERRGLGVGRLRTLGQSLTRQDAPLLNPDFVAYVAVADPQTDRPLADPASICVFRLWRQSGWSPERSTKHRAQRCPPPKARGL